MNEQRKQDVLTDVLKDLSEMNIGPGQNVPVKTIWLRATNRGVTEGAELTKALQLGVDSEWLTFTAGGIANMGSITLTDTGYAIMHGE